MTLVEDGLLDLDAPVVEHLPDFALADQAHADRITMRHLLEQTCGIPEGTGITDRFERSDDPYGEAVADLADVEPSAAPGEIFQYASANYVVAGAVIRPSPACPMRSTCRSAVLRPIGMDAAMHHRGDAGCGARSTVGVRAGGAVETRFDQTGPSYGYLGGTSATWGVRHGASGGRMRRWSRRSRRRSCTPARPR